MALRARSKTSDLNNGHLDQYGHYRGHYDGVPVNMLKVKNSDPGKSNAAASDEGSNSGPIPGSVTVSPEGENTDEAVEGDVPSTAPQGDAEIPRHTDQPDRQPGAHGDAPQTTSFAQDIQFVRDAGFYIPRSIDRAEFIPDTSVMVLTLAGDAAAFGQDTYANGGIFTDVVDFGSVTIARGVVDFVALAEGGNAFASALAMAEAVGYDILYMWDQSGSRTFESRDGHVYAGEHARTMIVAIDFENFDLADGPIEIFGNRTQLPTYISDLLAAIGLPPDTIDENIATLQIDANALGENTLADAMGSAFTVEDQLSTVSGQVIIGVA